MGFLSQRKKSGLSQYAVAEKVGVDQSAVCLWETGKNAPRAAVLVKLAKLYGCTVDELLTPDQNAG